VTAQRAASIQGPDALSLAVEETDSVLLLRLAGDFDLAGIGRVMAALDRIDVERTTSLVFDLQHVAFLDLAGLRTILRAADHCREHDIQVKVITPRGLASRVFTLTSAHRQLNLVYPNEPAKAVPTPGALGVAGRSMPEPPLRGQPLA
jgi:anti-anti-sigma factor